LEAEVRIPTASGAWPIFLAVFAASFLVAAMIDASIITLAIGLFFGVSAALGFYIGARGRGAPR
jgi:hypothetical protein